MKGGADREFEAYVAAHAVDLVRLARRLSVDSVAADDLVQTTLLRVWRSWPRVQSATDQQAYVRRVMVNAATSGWRRRWRMELPSDWLPERPSPDAQASVDHRDQLTRAMRQLPARQRAAVVLRYFVDLDDAAIAATLGCSVGTVRSQISRALTRLRVATNAAGDENLPQPATRTQEQR